MYKIKKIRADHVIDFAAEELKKYLRMMMPQKGEIPISFDPAATEGFRLGLLEDFDLPCESDNVLLDDIVHIDTDECGGILAGSNPRSVLFAVYRFLRLNGCRWLYPGIDGEHVPVAQIAATKYHKLADHRFRGHCKEGAESQQCMLETIAFSPKIGLNTYMIEFDIPKVYYDWYYDHKYNDKIRHHTMSQECHLLLYNSDNTHRHTSEHLSLFHQVVSQHKHSDWLVLPMLLPNTIGMP